MATVPAAAHEIVVVPALCQDGQVDIRQQCYDVRIDVFHREQGFPLDTEIDEWVSFSGACFSVGELTFVRMDEIAVHFLLRLLPSLKPVGTIRAYKSTGTDYYKLSRLAVLPDYRRHRFGRELVLALHNWVIQEAKQAGVQHATVVSHSQLPVKSFYSK